MSFDLKLINGDLVIQNGELQTVTNSEKLIQDILKICLTEQRLRSLGQAIDGALDRISRDISDAKAKVEALRDRAHGLEKDIPSSHDISKELQLSFTAAAGDLQISLGAGSTAFKALLSLLEKKGRSTQYQGGCGQTSCGSRGSRVGQDGDAAGGGLKCCYRGAQYVLRRIQRGAGQGARN